jgi:hypothetical protein
MTDLDLVPVHERLKAIFAPYREQFVVSKDGPGGMYLETPGNEGKPWGYVGGTRLGKRYVSFYLMGAYDGGLQASMSPELLKRMQGKTCFNFTRIDEGLFAELASITAKAIERHPEVVRDALAARADVRTVAKRQRSSA